MGELFKALLRGKSREEVEHIAEFVKEYYAYKNIRISEEEAEQAAEKLSGMRMPLG